MNVLILTDFSEVSINAGRYAIDLLREKTVNFHLLNIAEFNFEDSQDHSWNNQLVGTLERLQKSIATLESYSKQSKHRFHTRLFSDNLIKSVRKSLSEKKIDLIFIGAVSNAKHSHPLLGDHAYDVVRKIKCNIIVVPGNCKFSQPERILFPLDHSLSQKIETDAIYNSLDYMPSSEIKTMEIREKTARFQKENMEVIADFNSETFGDIQKKFDLVFVLGKNLNVCDRLLHKEYGISAGMKMEIPIFVYHG